VLPFALVEEPTSFQHQEAKVQYRDRSIREGFNSWIHGDRFEATGGCGSILRICAW